jgi:hypothetical protein
VLRLGLAEWRPLAVARVAVSDTCVHQAIRRRALDTAPEVSAAIPKQPISSDSVTGKLSPQTLGPGDSGRLRAIRVRSGRIRATVVFKLTVCLVAYLPRVRSRSSSRQSGSGPAVIKIRNLRHAGSGTNGRPDRPVRHSESRPEQTTVGCVAPAWPGWGGSRPGVSERTTRDTRKGSTVRCIRNSHGSRAPC